MIPRRDGRAAVAAILPSAHFTAMLLLGAKSSLSNAGDDLLADEPNLLFQVVE